MGLFTPTTQEKHQQSLGRGKSTLGYGDLSGLSIPFKKADSKTELNHKKIIQELDKYDGFPTRKLEEAALALSAINRVTLKPKKRLEIAEHLTSYIYPVVTLWYEKYQQEENSLPESSERGNALVASINAIQQLSTFYKLLFREHYQDEHGQYRKVSRQAYQYACRALELIRLEQRLRALRYQKLTKVAWQHCNQLFFALLHHNHTEDDYSLIGLTGIKKESDKLRKASVPVSNARKIFLSIQLFGLLDVTTWPTRLFHVPDGYLDHLGNGLKILKDDGKPLLPGFLVTYHNSQMPPLFSRMKVSPEIASIKIDYSVLYNTLVKDHKELGKQQFLEQHNSAVYSKPLTELRAVDQIPVIEMIILGLTNRERRQKRHAAFDSKGISVYFGYKEVSRLLKDMASPDQRRVQESRQFIDTLAMSSAMLAEEDKSHMATSWNVTNFSSGGLLISTSETDFSNPIQIDQLMAFTMPDNKKHPVLGFVRRLNRPDSKQVEVAIVRLSNYAETAGVQNQDELDTSTAKAVILIKDVRGQWNLIIKTSMPYNKGQPLKLIRANGQQIPVRLGEVVYTKKDFKVFELRSPGLEVQNKSDKVA